MRKRKRILMLKSLISSIKDLKK